MLHIRFRFLACKVVSFGRSHASHLQGLSNRETKIGLRPIFPRQGWAHHTIFKRFIGGDLSTTMTSVLQENRSENLPGPIEKKQKKADPVITTLRVKKLSVDATLPTRGSEKAAGYDLSSAKDLVVPARGKALIPTDISIAIPPGTYARIAPRSGLAHKHFIDTGAGVVDEDYRGPVGVILFNHSSEDFKVSKGDRIAQLILERILTPEVEEVENLDETIRGACGYGSTGVSV